MMLLLAIIAVLLGVILAIALALIVLEWGLNTIYYWQLRRQLRRKNRL
jgi:hypothetical protein